MCHRYDTRLYKGYDEAHCVRPYEPCDRSLKKSDIFSLFNIGLSLFKSKPDPRDFSTSYTQRQPLLTGYTPIQDQQTLAVAVVGSAVALAAIGGIFWIKRRNRIKAETDIQAQTDEEKKLLALNKADEGSDCTKRFPCLPACVSPCLGRLPITFPDIHVYKHQESGAKCRPHRCRRSGLTPASCSTITTTPAPNCLQSPVISSWDHQVPLVTAYRIDSVLSPMRANRTAYHTRIAAVNLCEKDKSQNESGLPACLADLPMSPRVSCRADTCNLRDTCTGSTLRFNRSSSSPACLKQGSHPPVFSRIFPTHSNRLKMSEQASAPPKCELGHDPKESMCCAPKTFYTPHGPDTSDTRRASYEEMEVKVEAKVHQECFTSVREPCCPAQPPCTDCTCLCKVINAESGQASGAECKKCQVGK